MSRNLSWTLATSAWLGLTNLAHADAFDDIYTNQFPDVIQGHQQSLDTSCTAGTDSEFKTASNPSVIGLLSPTIKFCKDKHEDTFTCVNEDGSPASCAIENASVPMLSLPSFQYQNGGSDVSDCDDPIVATDLKKVKIKDCSLEFPANDYRMEELKVENNATVELAAGDYWIEKLEIDGSTLVLSGDVRIFTSDEGNGEAKFEDAQINASGGFQLLLVSYEKVKIKNAQFNGFVYADGDIKVEQTSQVNGRLTAKKVELKDSSQVTNADVPTLDQCELVFPTPVNGYSAGHQANLGNHRGAVIGTIAGALGYDSASQINAGNQGCDGGACIESSLASAMTDVVDPFPLDSSGDSYNLGFDQSLTLSEPDALYNVINMNNKAQLNLDAAGVKIKQLNVGSGRSGNPYSVKLAPGEYWIESLSLGFDTQIQITGDTVLHVGSLSLPSGGFINTTGANISGDSSQLTIMSYGSIVMGNTSTIAANIYQTASGSLTMNSASFLFGKVTSPSVSLGFNSVINGNQSGCALPNPEPDPLQCYSDDFNRSDLGDDWIAKVLGSSDIPSIQDNQRLRITADKRRQAAALTYQKLFPAEGNKVVLEFDYNAWSPNGGQGADGVAVVLSDSTITPQPGSYGGSLGYAQRNDGTPGFAGGWIGIGLDEYGNYSNPNEGRVGGTGFERQAVAIRGSEQADFVFLAGTGGGLNPPVDQRQTNTPGPNHKYRITLDSQIPGKHLIEVERDSGAGYEVLIPSFDAYEVNPAQGDIPEKFYLSLTGSTGGAFNNHEIDNFKVCSIKSEPVGQLIDHFEFDYSQSPLTCKAETMTVRACANSDCSELITGEVRANLSPAAITDGAWLPSNTLIFSGGSTTVDLRLNTSSPTTIGVSGSIPSTRPGSDTLCRRGSSGLNSANCTLSFANAGFEFDVPDNPANKPIENVLIRAVKKDDSSQACVPLFQDTTKSIDFWSQYIDPADTGRPESWPVAVQQQNVGGNAAQATPVSLDFNSNGEALMRVDYADAGKVELNARYLGSDDEQGLVLEGADQFVSYPVGLCVSTQANCASGDSSCSVFKRAGEGFELSIQAKAWLDNDDADLCNNPNTPNYAHAGIELGAQLIAPSAGRNTEVSLKTYDHLAAKQGLTKVTQTSSEVGVFQFTATPPSSYLGVAAPIAKGVSDSSGRFVPSQYAISGQSIIAGCSAGGFSYMAQPFTAQWQVEAQNIGGQRTQNYFGDFAKASSQLVAANALSGNPLNDRLTQINGLNWALGQAQVNASSALARAAAPTVDGPYQQLRVGVQINDNDGGYGLVADPDMAASIVGNCSSANCDAKLIDLIDVRLGRLTLENTFGPESAQLSMSAAMEYWNGSTWQLNRDDQCSVLSTPELRKASSDTSSGYVYQPELSGAQSVQRNNDGNVASDGKALLLWRATNGYRGQVQAPLHLDNTPWLQWYWNWDGSSPTDLNEPRASAYFGTYRGNDRIIYWREIN
ncbi:DUF6701 domain-containing protein [Paraferrimonas haliotis]|uniref:DUF6701 domain-containing protein n=1 Tax=Paraferrimonas haliotis TaxID=2013866 RepID=UPI000BA94D26|nr:DUF6701 domain-containing protein [Paraferrimonas haliotis]